jgi:hypothetical protein
MTGTAVTADEIGVGPVEMFRLEPCEDVLRRLLTEMFVEHWRHIVFGSLIQGAVFELTAEAPGEVSMLDGYLTAVFGRSHLHLCIGEHRGRRANPTDAELARHRRTARAEFFRVLSPEDRAPTSWGFRMFNGADEQQLTVFLPNPFLSDDMQVLKDPDWARLDLWDRLRASYLGLDPDPKDRTAKRFWHA